MNALIGYTGFVGTTLLKQRHFDALYRSVNIEDIHGKNFETVVCAGAPAQKWLANRKPKADKENITGLIARLNTISCKKFILISTVDVFKTPIGVYESDTIEENGLHAYGLNRRLLEKFVIEKFPNHLIVRLPGLVGPGLRKNIIFDFLNQNNLSSIESRGIFQFYPMVNLWYDIERAIAHNLNLVHLCAAPISVADVARLGFGRTFTQTLDTSPAMYDMRTLYAKHFGGSGDYQYSVRETLQAIRTYAQAEPKKQ